MKNISSFLIIAIFLLLSCADSDNIIIICHLSDGYCQNMKANDCVADGGTELNNKNAAKMCKKKLDNNIKSSSSEEQSGISSSFDPLAPKSSSSIADAYSSSQSSSSVKTTMTIAQLLANPNAQELSSSSGARVAFFNAQEAAIVTDLRPSGTVYAYAIPVYLSKGSVFTGIMVSSGYDGYYYIMALENENAVKYLESDDDSVSYMAAFEGMHYIVITSKNAKETGTFGMRYYITDALPANRENLFLYQDFETNEGLDGWWVTQLNPVNEWLINDDTYYSGNYSAYISNGLGNAYTATSKSASHLLTIIELPKSPTGFLLTFYYKGTGETPSHDYMSVYLTPTSVIPESGTVLPAKYKIGKNYYNGSAYLDWKLVTIELPQTDIAGYRYNLVFSWVNDGSNGGTAAAIDNITITY